MTIHQDYKKAKDVIASCDDFRQLHGAKRFMNLFFRKYSTPSKNNTYFADDMAVDMYNRLQKLYYVRKYQLTQYID